eukprot:8317864-Prorocentrum_lima.AAC.1
MRFRIRNLSPLMQCAWLSRSVQRRSQTRMAWIASVRVAARFGICMMSTGTYFLRETVCPGSGT